GKRLGSKTLKELAQIVRPETILWMAPWAHRQEIRRFKESLTGEARIKGQGDRGFGIAVGPGKSVLGIATDSWCSEQSWTQR
ncbi:MAG: hypothetical protein ABI651_06915, partial [Verrucomicrobiota bacterium]